MTTIQSKRVYQSFDPSDGFRVLVDRLWPRGVHKNNLLYDLRAKEIVPSPTLREWYHTDIESHWAEFESSYLNELNHSMYAYEFLEQIEPHKTATLLYAAHNPIHNHVVVLKEYIESRQNKDHFSNSPNEL